MIVLLRSTSGTGIPSPPTCMFAAEEKYLQNKTDYIHLDLLLYCKLQVDIFSLQLPRHQVIIFPISFEKTEHAAASLSNGSICISVDGLHTQRELVLISQLNSAVKKIVTYVYMQNCPNMILQHIKFASQITAESADYNLSIYNFPERETALYVT